MHIVAAKAVCFKEAMEPAFADYQRQIVANAKRLAASITSHGFRLVSGGTDNHLMLVDVFQRSDRQGRRGGARSGRNHRQQERHLFDRNPLMVASGIRAGTPAVTTRGWAKGRWIRSAI